jgi:hypothetical protein
MDSTSQQVLANSILRLLRPLVRILLRNGIAFGTFSDLGKKVYTDVAFEEFTLQGKKQSVSRVSILTGLTRKEVKRLHDLPDHSSLTEEKRYNRATRVISGWLNDPLYCPDKKEPLPLPIDGGSPSFTQLVKSYSGDVPVQAILSELTSAKSVEQRDGRVYLVKHAYIPADDPVEKMHILGTDVEELISTINHNLTHNGDELRYQRKVSNDNLSSETCQAFKDLSAHEAQLLLERLDSWLTEHEQDPDSAQEQPSRRVRMGIYYYEEQSKE